MTKLQIRMRQVDQVKDFVDLLSKYPYEMDLVSGRYTIDAKSLLGIYSLDLSNPLTLVIYSDSCEELLTQLHALLRAGAALGHLLMGRDIGGHADGYAGGMTPLLDRDGKPVISSIER